MTPPASLDSAPAAKPGEMHDMQQAASLALRVPGKASTTLPAALAPEALPCRPGTQRNLGVRPELLSGHAPFTITAWFRLDDMAVMPEAGVTPYRTILSRQAPGRDDDSFLFGVRIGEQRELAFMTAPSEGRRQG